jgi:hypothetical protein
MLDWLSCSGPLDTVRGPPEGEPVLAITPGDTAAEQVRGFADEVLPWRDLLHEGPVPAGLDAAELAELRAAWVAGMGWLSEVEALTMLSTRDAALIEAAKGMKEICLWFDRNLVNQLALLQVLDRLAELRPGLDAVSLTGPRTFGRLPDDEVRTLFAARQPVTTKRADYARRAWEAFRDNDPTMLLPFATATEAPLPHLASALTRHLQQFPADDGLGHTERRALEAVAAGKITFAEIFAASTADDDPPFLADTVLKGHLARLSSGPRPLLRYAEGYEITAHGLAVSRGDADRIELTGIDHWLGGVHLTSGNVWRRHPNGQLLRGSPR